MFNQLKWVTFPEGVIYQKAIQMYKLFVVMHQTF